MLPPEPTGSRPEPQRANLSPAPPAACCVALSRACGANPAAVSLSSTGGTFCGDPDTVCIHFPLEISFEAMSWALGETAGSQGSGRGPGPWLRWAQGGWGGPSPPFLPGPSLATSPGSRRLQPAPPEMNPDSVSACLFLTVILSGFTEFSFEYKNQ